MRSSRVVPYLLISVAVLLAGSGMSADTGAQPRSDALPASAVVASAPPTRVSASLPISRPGRGPSPSFPSLYRLSSLHRAELLSLEVPDEAEAERAAAAGSAALPLLANNQILAFYGKPAAKQMGILGEYSKEELGRLLQGYAKLYDDANGEPGVVPAYYLIYGTCWPGGEIGYLKDSVVQDYIDYAAAHGMIVFVDHQIGKYTVEEAMGRLLPFLKYPNVHIALDPEWRTTLPMKEIGSISAEELNKAEKMMEDYIEAQGIPGDKMLVVHQFRYSMIQGREKVRADYERVQLIHTADGFGSPSLKRNTYAMNSLASNMPLKGFKLFFKTTVPGAGYDQPLLSPPEVLALEPKPVLIIYQ